MSALLNCLGLIAAAYYLVWLGSSSLAAARNRNRDGCKAPPRAPFFYGLYMYVKVRLRSQRYSLLPSQARLHELFGQTFASTVGTLTNIYTVHPDNIQAIWSTRFPDWGVEPVRLSALGAFCGRGILTVDGARWERTRNIIKPVFNRSVSVDLVTFEKYLSHVFARMPRGKSVDLQPLLFDMYFQVCYMFFVGEPIESLPEYGSVEIEKIRTAFDAGVLGARVRDMMGVFKYLHMDKDWNLSCRYARSFSDAVADHALQLQMKAAASGSGDQDESAQSLVYKFAQRDNRQLVDAALRNDIIQFFMAAPHTVAGVVTNALFLLSTHPEEWKKLRHEVSLVEKPFTVERLKAMTFMKNVFNESLRLYPSTTFEARTALTDTVLPVGGGKDGQAPIFVPKGVSVRANIYALHRNPLVFGEEPHAFIPDRWNTIKPKWWEFIPFGGGKRVCPGRDKAMAESLYALARFAEEFETLQSSQEGATQTTRDGMGCHVKAY